MNTVKIAWLWKINETPCSQKIGISTNFPFSFYYNKFFSDLHSSKLRLLLSICFGLFLSYFKIL